MGCILLKMPAISLPTGKMARLLPLRYTDATPYAPEEESAYGLLGGRVGPSASRSAALSSVPSAWRPHMSVLVPHMFGAGTLSLRRFRRLRLALVLMFGAGLRCCPECMRRVSGWTLARRRRSSRKLPSSERDGRLDYSTLN